MPRPWFPFYPRDYMAGTRDLDWGGHGVYMLLLSESWMRGPLPDDMRRLRTWCCGAPEKLVMNVLNSYWTLGSNGWFNERLELEREISNEKYELRARAGRIGGQRRQAMLKQCLSNAQANVNQPQPQPQEDLNTAPSVLVESPAFDPVDNSATPKLNGCPYQAIVDIYHEILVPPLPRVFKLTHGRRQHISARWREDLTDLDDWRAYFGAVRRTRLVSGFRRKDGTLWQPDFGWLLRPENFTKVTEGAYGQVR